MKEYRRLTEAINMAGMFSKTEIDGAYRAWLEYHSPWSSEAMNAFGGFKKVLRNARYQWRRALKYRGVGV